MDHALYVDASSLTARFFCYIKCSIPLLYKSHSSLERQVTCSVRITPSMAQDTLLAV